MSIKFWDHIKGEVAEVKNLNEDEFNGTIYVLNRKGWTQKTIDGEKVWVSPKGLKKLGAKGV